MRISSPLAVALALIIMTQAAPADDKRTRELVRSADGEIDVIVEGAGPLILLLPSRGRDSEDYDEVAHGLAQSGFRVLRPQPRGIGKSTGPLQGLTLHDFARDVAAVISHYGGPAVIVGHAYGNWGRAHDRGRPSPPRARRGDRRGGRQDLSARAQRGRHQERRPVVAEGGAAEISARNVLRAR